MDNSENSPAPSIVRRNLMTQPGYSPYCGAENCRHRWPRTSFDGNQFACRCGWRSSFEAEFIDNYKKLSVTASGWSAECGGASSTLAAR